MPKMCKWSNSAGLYYFELWHNVRCITLKNVRHRQITVSTHLQLNFDMTLCHFICYILRSTPHVHIRVFIYKETVTITLNSTLRDSAEPYKWCGTSVQPQIRPEVNGRNTSWIKCTGYSFKVTLSSLSTFGYQVNWRSNRTPLFHFSLQHQLPHCRFKSLDLWSLMEHEVRFKI